MFMINATNVKQPNEMGNDIEDLKQQVIGLLTEYCGNGEPMSLHDIIELPPSFTKFERAVIYACHCFINHIDDIQRRYK